MMVVRAFTFNPFETQCYVCHSAGEAVVVDPGCWTVEEAQTLFAYLDAQALVVRHLLLTHAHLDHLFGCAALTDRYGLLFQMHRADLPLLVHASEQAARFGLSITPPPVPEHFLAEGDTVAFGDTTWRVLHTPGHSPGSICFHDARHGFVIGGDVLFRGSIGRTDLWQGALPVLMTSIYQHLLTLPAETILYPGHGQETTIGEERRTNPYLRS